MKEFFKKNFAEISSSRVLQYYGAALGATHIFTYFFWQRSGNRLLRVAHEQLRVCWPIWPNCENTKITSELLAKLIMGGFITLAVVSAVLFLWGKYLKWAYGFAVVLLFFKFAVFFQDYRMMGNYHYMPYWLMFAFLFFPDKKRSMAILIPLFYCSAAALKFNAEWLSAVTFIRPVQLPLKLVEWLCAYVPLLETIIVWGLLANNAIIFWFAFFQFACFHIFSYFVVDWFYPTIMACVLSLYPLLRVLDFVTFEKINFFTLRRSAQFLVSFFVVLQFAPYFYKGDSALTGQGRMVSLNMLDAKSQCDDFIYLKYRNGETIEVPRIVPTLAVRINCDPLVLFAEAKRYCLTEGGHPNFYDLDIGLSAKRSTDVAYQKILEIRNFCRSSARIDILGGISL